MWTPSFLWAGNRPEELLSSKEGKFLFTGGQEGKGKGRKRLESVGLEELLWGADFLL